MCSFQTHLSDWIKLGVTPKKGIRTHSFLSWFLADFLPLKAPFSHCWFKPTFRTTSPCFPYHAVLEVRQLLSHLICIELFQALQITFNPIHNAGCDSRSELGQRKVILGEDPHRTRQFYHPHNSKLTAAADKTQTDILGGDLSTLGGWGGGGKGVRRMLQHLSYHSRDRSLSSK